MSLTITSKDLWPRQARKILEDKCIDLHQLKKSFYQVYFPWDTEYSQENVYFSLRIQQRPLIIIRPNSEEQLEQVLNFVYYDKLTVRFMNGRHSTQLVNPEVLVDISYFDNVRVHGNKIICGGGSTQGKANDVLFSDDMIEHCHIYSHFGHFTHGSSRYLSNLSNGNLSIGEEAFAGGSAATVGVGGISTVGGIGVLARSFGLTIDSVISYKITLPPNGKDDAKTVVVDKCNHPDLYWALRGGGGANFGIISSIKFKILEVPQLIQYSVTFPWIQAENVLNFWKHTSPKRPNNYDEELGLSNNNISLNGYYVFNEDDTIESAIRNVSNELSGLVDSFSGTLTFNTDNNYPEIYRKLVKGRTYNNFSVIQAFFVDNFNSKEVVDFINETSNPVLNNNSSNGNNSIPFGNDGDRSISFQLLGGVIKNISSDCTAYYPRQSNFFMDISSRWDLQTSSQENNDWTNRVVKSIIDNHHEKIMYLGFPISFSNIQIENTIYNGSNYPRLKEIKNKYDPLNILTSSGSIF